MGEGYRFWLIGDILSYCASRFGNRSLSRRKRSRKSRHAPLSRRFEFLENRNLLSTVVWTGGGTDNLLSDDANYAGSIAPSNNDAIVFSGSTNTSPYDDLMWLGPGSVEFQTNNFNLSGVNLGVSNVIVDPGVTATVSANIVGPNSLTETGSGTLIVAGTTIIRAARTYWAARSSSVLLRHYLTAAASLSVRAGRLSSIPRPSRNHPRTKQLLCQRPGPVFRSVHDQRRGCTTVQHRHL